MTRMAMGKGKRRARQATMWLATSDLPMAAAHPFYTRLNQILDTQDFDGYVEGLCQRFYAEDGRPGLPPGRYFRLLLIGYFEGLDAERAIAWRAADSLALREFLGLVLPEAPPDHSTISRTRRLIDLETHQAVFTWMCNGVRMRDWSRARPSVLMPRRWKPTRRCAASCAAIRARAIRNSVGEICRLQEHIRGGCLRDPQLSAISRGDCPAPQALISSEGDPDGSPDSSRTA
jgi:hypothetical protein